MKAILRLERALLNSIYSDLDRPHPFAKERVGFVACSMGTLKDGHLLLANSYHPVDDEDYEDDSRVGAMMGSSAIRKALQLAYSRPLAMFHIHRHEHRGRPEFSKVDIREGAKFVPDFFKVRPQFPHGMLVLSHNAVTGAWWNPESRETRYFDEITVVGRPFMTFRSKR